MIFRGDYINSFSVTLNLMTLPSSSLSLSIVSLMFMDSVKAISSLLTGVTRATPSLYL